MDVLSYLLAKQHANTVALGISEPSVNGTTVSFKINETGEIASVTLPTPENGISISSVSVDSSNHLIVTYSDGNTEDAGVITTVKGDKGQKGDDGFSPTATVTKADGVATITVTDANGTTTATIEDGKAGEVDETQLANAISDYMDTHGVSVPIESISVNGTVLTPDENKNVDITVQEELSNKEVVEKFSEDADGNILYNGSKIQGEETDLSSYSTTEQMNEAISTATTDMATQTYVDNQVENLVSSDDLDTKLANYAKSTDLVDAYSKTETDDAITTAITPLATKEELEALETEINTSITENTEAIVAHKELIDETVSTLVGDDTNKSVRIIANEELSTQLITENAQESLNTLQEVAQWIQEHPENASAMNLAIEENTTVISELQETITENSSAISNLETSKVDKTNIQVVTGLYTDGDDNYKISSDKKTATVTIPIKNLPNGFYRKMFRVTLFHTYSISSKGGPVGMVDFLIVPMVLAYPSDSTFVIINKTYTTAGGAIPSAISVTSYTTSTFNLQITLIRSTDSMTWQSNMFAKVIVE